MPVRLVLIVAWLTFGAAVQLLWSTQSNSISGDKLSEVAGEVANETRGGQTVRVAALRSTPWWKRVRQWMQARSRTSHWPLFKARGTIPCPSTGTAEKLIFIHIPKNAGTTIEDVAYAAGTQWGRMADYSMCSFENNCHAKWHQAPRDIRGASNYREIDSFCIVQHPLHRAVSQYKYLVSHQEYAFNCAEIIKEHGCTPEGLNSCLHLLLQHYDPTIAMCHMRPQSEYIYDAEGKQVCDHILRLEEFPTPFNELMKQYNYSMRLVPDERHNEDNCSLSVSDLSSKMQSKLLNLYSEDYKRLDYDKHDELRLFIDRHWKGGIVDQFGNLHT